MAVITIDPIYDEPCPRAGITLSDLGNSEVVVTVWRVSDSARTPVRGARMVPAVDSMYVEDYEVPLARSVRYELEVVSGSAGYYVGEVLHGADAGMQGVVGNVTVASKSGYIQDPLNPANSVPINAVPNRDQTVLDRNSFTSMSYESASSSFTVMGADRPVVVGGRRQAASGVPLSMTTFDKEENFRLRQMVKDSHTLVIRPLPGWGDALPGSATYSAPSFEETPLRHAMGGTLTRWTSDGTIVRGSSARVVVALWTFQDDAQLFAIFDQKQLSAGGGTFLDDQKNPANI